MGAMWRPRGLGVRSHRRVSDNQPRHFVSPRAPDSPEAAPPLHERRRPHRTQNRSARKEGKQRATVPWSPGHDDSLLAALLRANWTSRSPRRVNRFQAVRFRMEPLGRRGCGRIGGQAAPEPVRQKQDAHLFRGSAGSGRRWQRSEGREALLALPPLPPAPRQPPPQPAYPPWLRSAFWSLRGSPLALTGTASVGPVHILRLRRRRPGESGPDRHPLSHGSGPMPPRRRRIRTNRRGLEGTRRGDWDGLKELLGNLPA